MYLLPRRRPGFCCQEDTLGLITMGMGWQFCPKTGATRIRPVYDRGSRHLCLFFLLIRPNTPLWFSMADESQLSFRPNQAVVNFGMDFFWLSDYSSLSIFLSVSLCRSVYLSLELPSRITQVMMRSVTASIVILA